MTRTASARGFGVSTMAIGMIQATTSPGATNGNGAAPHDERVEQLERLGRLHDMGTLDDDEFRAEKQRILSATAP